MSILIGLVGSLWGSVLYRPYVYVFFASFLAFSVYHMGWKRTTAYTLLAWSVAFGCEYSSTRNGFPFGFYEYFDDARHRELWISNVPFWDSLSFVFLSYFSWILAASIVDRKNFNEGLTARWTPWITGLLMMLLDIVIDPVALQGDKWFLGKIYAYSFNGFYFGVTAANFAGWFFVGFSISWIFGQWIRFSHSLGGFLRKDWNPISQRNFLQLVFAMYGGVFLFNEAITIYIGDHHLAAASAAVIVLTMGGLSLCIPALKA